MKEPYKPKPPKEPTKPLEPDKWITNRRVLSGLKTGLLIDYINENNVKLEDVYIEIGYDEEYEDEYINLYVLERVKENPNYEKQLKVYNEALELYEKNIIEYKENTELYKEKLKQYNAEFNEWYNAKKIEALQKEIDKLKK